MQQDARAVADHPEVPVPGGVVGAEGDLAREAASSGAGNAGGHGAAGSESDEEEDIEEAQTEESERVVAPVGNAGQEDAPGSAQNEDHEVPENPAAIHFELRGFRPARRAIAHAMPPSSYRRLPLRGRKRPNPTRSIVVGDAASGVSFSNAYDPGTSEAASGPPPSASLGSPSATSRSAGVSAMANAGNGDSNEALGSTARRSGNSGIDAKDVAAAEASSSRRLPSRGRKQRRPDQFISDSEEAASADRAKAHRSNTAPDRFLTSSVRAAPTEQRPEWVRKNITEGSVRDQGQSGNDVLRTASGGVPEEPDGSARILAVAAILGAALALSVVSGVLFYIVGQQTASGPRDSHKEKVSVSVCDDPVLGCFRISGF
ncbi:uncharacterized protein [Setaria viridis]|uniref:uncharacterized protein n=1 Tax=Setaria viridis TaxID=4556 RepID=UPI003B3B87DF